MSFTDSFLDFEAIKNWFDSIPNPDMASGEKVDIGVLEAVRSQETVVQELVFDGSSSVVIAEEKECEMAENASWSIEKDMGKFSLVGESGNSIDVCESDPKSETMERNDGKREAVSEESGNLNGVGESGSESKTIDGIVEKKEAVSDEEESGSSESERASTSSPSSSSSSSSSSCSSSDDDDDEGSDGEAEERQEQKAGEAGEVEEGEIRDVDVQDVLADENGDENGDVEYDIEAIWSDIDDEDGEEGDGMKGPIRSKNEAKVLPPVPPVDATLLPHHLMQPLGVVLSIIGTQVVVEGIKKHSPLSDGSILWVTESRSPLGLVDEIFGPVKNPYYIVRYNSEAEVPSGVSIGTSVSFVPEFASHVLDNKDIHKKGYDASGANDEEFDDGEFSDDEKEAEFKRMQKALKRGTTEQKPRKNKSNKNGVENRGSKFLPQQTSIQAGPVPPPNQYHPQHQFSPFPNSVGLAPTLPSMWPNGPPNGVWSNGMPLLQPPDVFFPNGFPTNNMPRPSQNPQQYPYQMPVPNNVMPFNQNQQVNLNIRVLPGQPNDLGGIPFGQGFVGQNGFNNTMPFGMGLVGQPSPPPTLNHGGQGFASNGLVMGQNFNMPQSGGFPGNNDGPQQFNPGPSSRGAGNYKRGGGRLSRGRGRRQ